MPDIIDPNSIATALFLATLVNRLVAMLVTPLFERRGWDKKYVLYVAVLLGVAIAFAFNADLFTIAINHYVGVTVTGVVVGGGANLIHDLLDKPQAAIPQ